MPQEVTRRRFMFQTLGVIGGATVSGDLLPLLAEAAKRKQVLRVAIERDFETLRPSSRPGDTNHAAAADLHDPDPLGHETTARWLAHL